MFSVSLWLQEYTVEQPQRHREHRDCTEKSESTRHVTNQKNIEAIYPLSPLQEGMLFHSLYAPDSGVYVVQLCYRITGQLNVDAFTRAWREVMARHYVLCTSFHADRDKPLQIVHRNVELPWAEYDWNGFSTGEQREKLQQLLNADRESGFDPARPPLMRVMLIKLAADSYQFVWSFHHLLLDGWSMPLLHKEILLFYNAYCEGKHLQLPRPRPYREYIAWLQQQDTTAAEVFWRDTLKGFRVPTPLGLDRPVDTNDASYRYEIQETKLSRELTDALRNFAQQHQLTVNTVVEGAWALLLNAYSGEEDIVIGAITSGRPADLPGVDSMVGLFINTLPVRVRISATDTLVPWLRRLQETHAEMRRYEYSPLVQIQGWSEVPLEDAVGHVAWLHASWTEWKNLFVFENYPLAELLREDRWSLQVDAVTDIEKTNYPLTVVVNPGPQLLLRLCYEYPRFDDATVTRMLTHFRAILENIAARPMQHLSQVQLLPDSERRRIIYDWNDSRADFPDGQSVHRLFEQQVNRTPDAIAIDADGVQLSYNQLDRSANQLAHYLRKLGVGPERLVGICVERSPEMIVGMLAILKAGGGYLPLDPSYPMERLEFIINDADVEVLLAQKSESEQLPKNRARVVYLDEEFPLISLESDKPVDVEVTSDSLAYVIYTSGSTGKPKGVMLSHRGVCNLSPAMAKLLDVRPGRRVLQFAALGFDATVEEVFKTLLSGATLCLTDRYSLMPGAPLLELLLKQAITNITIPPSVLASLPDATVPALDTILVAGEACAADVVARWARGRNFFNAYGPSEATVCTTMTLCKAEREAPPIGRPIDNVQVYLLDKFLRPVPVGARGELYIGGASVGRNYLRRPALTAERFIPDPFGGEPGTRLYRTGDLARHRADGQIEYQGRTDNQVKVRGYRIEPGEVEAALEQHPDVNEAAVVVRTGADKEKQLVAYVVPRSAPAPDELRKFLAGRLPQFIIPSAFVSLDALPLTPIGKLDRDALPAPETLRPKLEVVYAQPRTEVEREVAAVWQTILGVERVGADDNFFDLGAHSLMMVRAHARLTHTYGKDLPLVSLFRYPTVRSLAQHLSERKQAPVKAQLDEQKTAKIDQGVNRLHQLRQAQHAARQSQ